jgi:ubiquinone biosynthesis protein Coq4
MTQQTGNVDQKETREIKLEQLVVVVMAMEIFVHLVVKMIGGKNMEQESLTTLADYINLE